MPPASSYRPLRPAVKVPSPPRPAIKAPSPPQDDNEPVTTPKRKREMVAVACNNCRSRKIARRPALPSVCAYRDKHETHAALRQRTEALQAKVTTYENTMSLLINLPADEALRLLHHLRSTCPPAPPREAPPKQNNGGPRSPPAPSPPSLSSPSSLLPDDVSAPPGDYRYEDEDHHKDNDDDDDGAENHHANPEVAMLSLSTTYPGFEDSGSQGSVHAFVYLSSKSDSGESLYQYENGPLAMGRLPTTPTAEPDTQW